MDLLILLPILLAGDSLPNMVHLVAQSATTIVVVTTANNGGIGDSLGLAATIAGGIVAAIVLLAGAYRIARRTMLRKWSAYANLRRLGPQTQLSFFTSVLGEPPAIRHRVQGKTTEYVGDDLEPVDVPTDYWECIWIDNDYYVQAVADKDETVLAFSVSTRNKKFNPRFRSPAGYFEPRSPVVRGWAIGTFAPSFNVRLGKTTLDQAIEYPGDIYAWLGAHNWGYQEIHWGANPGLYQHFVLSINDAGFDPWSTVQTLFPPEEFGGEFRWTGDPPYEEVTRLAEFRRTARANTFTVIGPALSPEDYPVAYGPRLNEVRVVP
jgi:hypothetical protein